MENSLGFFSIWDIILYIRGQKTTPMPHAGASVKMTMAAQYEPYGNLGLYPPLKVWSLPLIGIRKDYPAGLGWSILVGLARGVMEGFI